MSSDAQDRRPASSDDRVSDKWGGDHRNYRRPGQTESPPASSSHSRPTKKEIEEYEKRSAPKEKETEEMPTSDAGRRTRQGILEEHKSKLAGNAGAADEGNSDDEEGHYRYRVGETLGGRYVITAPHRRGVGLFCAKSVDPSDRIKVMIKILSSKLEAGGREMLILRTLRGYDPDDRAHCVRLISTFMHARHQCLVFESLHMDLAEVMYHGECTFSTKACLKLSTVRVYAQQIFIALKHLRTCGVLHCDIRPHTILAYANSTKVKLCDFGNAMFADDAKNMSPVVRCNYQAPEIILGLKCGHPVDLWCAGCCLFELYTGKALFEENKTNADMLRSHMTLKGPFPEMMLKRGRFTKKYFVEKHKNFFFKDLDTTEETSMSSIVRMDITERTRSIRDGVKMKTAFVDLLNGLLHLDPHMRMTAEDALAHPFINPGAEALAKELRN